MEDGVYGTAIERPQPVKNNGRRGQARVAQPRADIEPQVAAGGDAGARLAAGTLNELDLDPLGREAKLSTLPGDSDVAPSGHRQIERAQQRIRVGLENVACTGVDEGATDGVVDEAVEQDVATRLDCVVGDLHTRKQLIEVVFNSIERLDRELEAIGVPDLDGDRR